MPLSKRRIRTLVVFCSICGFVSQAGIAAPQINRRSDGWTSSAKRQSSGVEQQPAVQRAFYQPQASLLDSLPPIPAGVTAGLSDAPANRPLDAGALPDFDQPNFGQPSIDPPSAVSSALPPGLQGGAMPSGSSRSFSDSGRREDRPEPQVGRPVSPPPMSAAEREQALAPRSQNGQQTQPYPGGNYPSNDFRNDISRNALTNSAPGIGGPAAPQRTPAANDGRIPGRTIAYQNSPQQAGYDQRNNGGLPRAGQGGGSDLRPIESNRLRAQGDRIDPRAVATGLPYVTSPSHYPTSRYNPAIFRNAAYQQQVNLRQQTQPGQLASNSQSRATAGNNMPQFQPTQYAQQADRSRPGVYPTQYQTGALDPNQGPSCLAPPTLPGPGAVPGSVVPPTYTPNYAPGVYSGNNSGYSPLLSLGQENYNVLLGRGLIGQPTVYVPGQPFRNFLRYLSP